MKKLLCIMLAALMLLLSASAALAEDLRIILFDQAFDQP